MNHIYLIDWQAAQRLGAMRNAGKEKYASAVYINQNSHEVGVCGELAFEQFSGIPVDTAQRAKGDGGIDFILPLKVDVKTSSRGDKLYVEEHHAGADIYVLAHYLDSSSTALVGWIWGYKVRQVPLTLDTKYKRSNHIILESELYPMYLLSKITSNGIGVWGI